MVQPPTSDRVFLFLQGPHGPFFGQLARLLRAAGAVTWRVGFNRGDAAFWRPRHSYIPFHGTLSDWPDRIATLLQRQAVTDLVVYGDTRPVHTHAIAAARAAGLTVHVFEEGYLRPYWITYERGGVSGNSPLTTRSIAEMRRALSHVKAQHHAAPARWGDLRQHIFYGALYHAFVLGGNRAYRALKPHRDISVAQELRLHLRRLALMPWYWASRVISTWRVHRGGYPFHLALLQLAHDASFLSHGPFRTQTDVIAHMLEGLAAGAPAHHHLVFKAHPLEDGRTPVRRDVRRLADALGVADRVHFLRGGKLAHLLDSAISVVTVTSTAAEQALWRGLPVKALGRAVYTKPELVSGQSLTDFFKAPDPPDRDAYQTYRQYLLETSQVPGSFYAARGRRAAIRQVADLMLDPVDRYTHLDRQMALSGASKDRDLPATPGLQPPPKDPQTPSKTGPKRQNRLN